MPVYHVVLPFQAFASQQSGAAVPELEQLELALNEMTVSSAKALAKALAGKTKLQRLNLRENELEDPGAIALSQAVQDLPSLQVLDLNQNQVNDFPPIS